MDWKSLIRNFVNKAILEGNIKDVRPRTCLCKEQEQHRRCDKMRQKGEFV